MQNSLIYALKIIKTRNCILTTKIRLFCMVSDRSKVGLKTHKSVYKTMKSQFKIRSRHYNCDHIYKRRIPHIHVITLTQRHVLILPLLLSQTDRATGLIFGSIFIRYISRNQVTATMIKVSWNSHFIKPESRIRRHKMQG